jgi:hypothetical protein
VPGGTTNLTTSKAKPSRQNGKANQNVKTSGRGMQTGGGVGKPKSNASKGGRK